MAVTRKQFPGAAVNTTITTPLNNISDYQVDISSTSGWPTGGNPWVVTINRGGTTEEQCLAVSRSSGTLSFGSFANRGYGDTVPLSHFAGESIECTVDPVTIDELNRIASLTGAQGEMLVFDGANLVELSAPAPGDHLVGDPTAPEGVKWEPKWVEVSASPPAIVEADGQQYYDTARQELMTTVAGVWRSATLGVVVVASTLARDALFGASGPAGRMVWVTDETRLYVGTGTAWAAIPKPGEFMFHYASFAALGASGLPVGSVGVTDDNDQMYQKRTSGTWYPIGVHFLGGSTPTETDVADGDAWSIPL